mgnify:CR=1 FL=1
MSKKNRIHENIFGHNFFSWVFLKSSSFFFVKKNIMKENAIKAGTNTDKRYSINDTSLIKLSVNTTANKRGGINNPNEKTTVFILASKKRNILLRVKR